VSRFTGDVEQTIGSVAVIFPSADKTAFTVPLSLLGGDNGRAAFKISVMQWVDDPVVSTGPIDWMPDLGQAAALLR
jgi:hypothetical protein